MAGSTVHGLSSPALAPTGKGNGVGLWVVMEVGVSNKISLTDGEWLVFTVSFVHSRHITVYRVQFNFSKISCLPPSRGFELESSVWDRSK